MRMNIDHRKLGTMTLVTALLGGCAGDNGTSTKSDSVLAPSSSEPSTSQDNWDDDTEGEPALPPFSRPFQDFVQNTARWSSFDVLTRAARVERGADEHWVDGEPGWGRIDPYRSYAEVDLEITNLTMFDNELQPRSTWDLILPDGTRVEQTNVLGLMAGPYGTVAFTLRYAVDEDFDLAGAVLELNGPKRGELAPETVPLDAPYGADIDAILTELQGKTFESARPTSSFRVRLDVVAATASRNSINESRRSAYGKVFVELLLDLTQNQFRNLLGDDFGIIVDGRLSRPVNSFNKVSPASSTARIPVLFEIDDKVKSFTVRLKVGSDSDLTPKEEWQNVEVRLR